MNNLSLIVAIDNENGIGKNNDLLCHVKEDLQYFKSKTINKTVILGYNTFLSLGSKLLPNRNHIIITNKEITIENALVYNNIDDVIEYVKNNTDTQFFVIGGAMIYKQFISYCDTLYITRFNKNFNADVFFPKINPDFKLISSTIGSNCQEVGFDYYFEIYQK